jgi:hypothetical protein
VGAIGPFRTCHGTSESPLSGGRGAWVRVVHGASHRDGASGVLGQVAHASGVTVCRLCHRCGVRAAAGRGAYSRVKKVGTSWEVAAAGGRRRPRRYHGRKTDTLQEVRKPGAVTRTRPAANGLQWRSAEWPSLVLVRTISKVERGSAGRRFHCRRLCTRRPRPDAHSKNGNGGCRG